MLCRCDLDDRVVFLVIKKGDSAFEIIFGTIEESHRELARNRKLSDSAIRGGGYACPSRKEIWNFSATYGEYDRSTVLKLLPDWKVEDRSDR